MTKRLTLFLDGTWNTVTSNTNVWRLRSLCRAAPDQLVYYNQGVGTRFGEKVRGGMLGYGLDQEVVEAYEWLMANYDAGDEIFLFGFSRGAYTARSLSGLISKCGLLEPGAPLGVGQIYERYRSKAPKRTIRELRSAKAKDPEASFDLEERWMLTYSAAIPIRFLGVWDTVGSLGVPFGSIPVLSSSNYTFLETDLRISNSFAYHALAIDEHREAFRPTLWTRTLHPGHPDDDYPARKPANVEQRWFPGAHANVGGGYDSDILAQLPLKWIMAKAALHGLAFRKEVVVDGNPATAAVTDSYSPFMYGLYRRLAKPYLRPIGVPPRDLGGGRFIETINETIDASVFDRWSGTQAYRPQNLQAWARSKHVELATMRGTRRADDPAIAVDEPVGPTALVKNTAPGAEPTT